jgi:hypothetical protein
MQKWTEGEWAIGTDASSNGMTESAIEEAHRAVHSLKGST